MAIGCENCHGAGAGHIQFQNTSAAQPADQTTTESVDSILNPSDLDHQRQEAVCYQCHLHAPGRILRPGRSHFDFRPGDRLDDIWSMVIADDGIDAQGHTEAVSHVQQMHVSRCYIESAGKMGCISCHNPHEKPAAADRVEYYRQSCLECHSTEACPSPAELRQEQGDSCIQCHMPARQAKRISHVSQTDHRILREPFAGETASEPTPNLDLTEDKFHFLWDTADRLSAWERKRAIGMTIWLKGSSVGRRPPPRVADILEEVIAEVPNDGPVLTVLGAFAAEYQRIPKARQYFEAALQDPMVRESALTNLLTLYYVSSDWNRALECANQILTFDKQNARIYALRADSLAHLGQFRDAIASAETALQLDPTMTPVRQWLEQIRRAN